MDDLSSPLDATAGERSGFAAVALAVGFALLVWLLTLSRPASAGGILLAAPVLYAVAVSGSALVAYLLYARASVLSDDVLRWAAAGYSLTAGAAFLQALTLAGFAMVDPFDISASGAAALYLIWHAVLPSAVVATALRRGRLERRLFIAGIVALLLVSVWEPDVLMLPDLVGPGGQFTTLYRVLAACVACYCLAGTVIWLVLTSRGRARSHAWIAVSLVLMTLDALLGAGSERFFAPAWWASASLRASQFALPAVGLLAEFVAQFKTLRRHERSLAERLQAEIRLALPGTNGSGGDEAAIRRRVRDVLDRGAITPVFQPIYDLRSGTVIALEALTRFSHPVARTPAVWFEEATRIGLGTELELAALRAALDALEAIPPDVVLNLNVSPATILDDRFATIIATSPRRCLALEVTEHAPIDDYQSLNAVLRRLRPLGVLLAIDDVGAGFSSLRHIVRLNPDVLKVDLSLTRDVHLDPLRRALVSALVSFAEQIDCMLVAEGVECDEELVALRELGAHGAQGFHLARPTTLRDALEHMGVASAWARA